MHKRNTIAVVCCAMALTFVAAPVVSGADDGAATGNSIVQTERQVGDAEARAELAHSEAMLGRVESARAQYRLLLQGTNVPWRLRMRYAESALLWGDVRGAEQIYRDYLVAFPGDRNAAVRLAEVLAASQQFEAAEGKYRELLEESPDDTALLLGLAGVKKAERDFIAALEAVARVRKQDQMTPAVLAARAHVLLRLGRYEDAVLTFEALAKLPAGSIEGRVGLGRCLLARGDKAGAAGVFADVLKTDAGNIEAAFLALLCSDGASSDGMNIVPRGEKKAERLVRWAGLCLENNFRAAAVQCLENAVAADRNSFPAKQALAQALAAERRFDSSVEIYGALHKQFPENYMILIEWARALSWARRYDDSIDLYRRAEAMCPGNPVSGREIARVLVWAGRMDEAQAGYARLWGDPVDVMLQKELTVVMGAAGAADEERKSMLMEVERLARTGTPCDAYEWFCGNMHRAAADAALAAKLQKTRVRLAGAYRIQKAAYLESEEKRLTWQGRYLLAAGACRRLVDFAPGNQEGIYDLSQLEFALGLDAEAAETTRRLLEMDPSHTFAPLVLNRMEVVDNPYLRAGGSYWSESGRDEISDIDRHQYEMAAGMPVMGRGYVEAVARHWEEHPGGTGDVFRADGFSVQGAGVLTPWLSAAASVTHKNYVDPEIPDTDTGSAGLSANLRDVLTLDLRRERADELYNRFGIGDGTHADSWFLQCRSSLARGLEIYAYERLIDYSDDNSGEQAYANLACNLTDHPRVLKASLFGETRDTDEESSYVREGGAVTDIVHPYWTPQNYSAWGAMLEWRHDVSPVYSRGTDLRYYDISLALRDDTENNATMEWRGSLHWETANRWLFALEGLLIRSDKWDATGVQASVKRHF